MELIVYIALGLSLLGNVAVGLHSRRNRKALHALVFLGDNRKAREILDSDEKYPA